MTRGKTMPGLPQRDALPTEPVRGRAGGLRRAAQRLVSRFAGGHEGQVELARVLDMFEEHIYAGEITADGRYVHHASMSSMEHLVGGHFPAGTEMGRFWESCIAPADWAQYEAFNRRLLEGEDAEVTYRLIG